MHVQSMDAKMRIHKINFQLVCPSILNFTETFKKLSKSAMMSWYYLYEVIV